MPKWTIKARRRSNGYDTFNREAFTATMMLRHVLDAIDGNFAEITISKYRSDKGQKKLPRKMNNDQKTS
jgi:hypothetical protein